MFQAETSLLRSYGHEVEVFVEDNRRIDTFNRVSLAARTIWSHPSYRKLLGILRKFRPDVVHFHNTFPLISPSGYYACGKVEVPVVQTVHNRRFYCPASITFRRGRPCFDCLGLSFAWPGILGRCYRGSAAQTAVVAVMQALHRLAGTWRNRVDLYIALSPEHRKKLVQAGLPQNKIRVKHNFVFSDPGSGVQGGDHALFVGRLTADMGVRTLIDAWKSLGPLPLKIVGEGPLRQELESICQSHGLTSVEFLGQRPREEVLSLMRRARFFIYPAERYDSIALVVMEAFACGVPVLASDLMERLDPTMAEKTSGLCFQVGSKDDLAEKARWAWDHPTQIERMGIEARKQFERTYSAQSNYEMLLDIYLSGRWLPGMSCNRS